MPFTKIAAAGIGSTGTITLENIIVTGSVNTPSITGAASTANVRTNSLVVSGVTTSSGGFVGNVSGNINSSGVSTFSGGIVGNVTGNATGLSGTPNIVVGSITASSATITGNVSVAGTVTYEDTTNVDSIGVVTARSGLQVTGGSVGVLTSNPRATVQVGTAVSQSVFITSTGFVGLGSTAPRVSLDASQETDAIALPQGTTSQRPSGNSPYIRYNTTNSALEFYNGTDWVEIISDYFPTGSTILG